MTRPRALFVITGSELVRGERADLNGPFLARETLALGLEPARITIVGDGEDELEAALREGLDADLLITTGGLGPTHDDRTVELLARVTGRELQVDPDLHDRIEGISRTVAERLRRPYADFEPGVRKQASLPAGAVSVGIAGTAPGLVLQHDGAAIVVLPGPPGELKRLWTSALATDAVRRVLERARPPGRRVLRFFGASESAIARALEAAGGERPGVEATICARDFEIHVDLVVEPGAESEADELERRLAEPLDRWLFARDERPIEELVLALFRARGLSLATAESCTGGLVAERLTRVPGSSAVFVGSIVAYADAVKVSALGVPRELIELHGAVSAEVAAAMARGVRGRLGADVGVGVTGIAGPGGATPDKPVGLVYVSVSAPDAERTIDFNYPSDRAAIRSRAAVAALHLVRRVLSQS
ncbi:MAG TPA: CinA family nicotinamide mononucleotide deamidase-related protein [Gaiellaceae bacterium]